MEFRRSGQRNDRRRRVFRDELAERDASMSAGADGVQGESTAPDYSRSARRPSQPRTVDLFPKRAWWLACVVLAMLAVAATVGWFEHRLLHDAQLSENAPASWTSTIRPRELGGFDAWFASVLLLAGSLTGMQVLSMRRFKSNDYRGTYRLWGWVSVALLLASIDATARWSLFFDAWMWSRWKLPSVIFHLQWSQWAITLIGFVCLVRLSMETKRSKAAVGSMALAVGCYMASLLGPPITHALVGSDQLSMHVDAVESTGESNQVATAVVAPRLSAIPSAFPSTACLLGGHILLLSCLMSYARYVYLEAHGLIRLRPSSVSQASRTKRRRSLAARMRLRRMRRSRLDRASESAPESDEASTSRNESRSSNKRMSSRRKTNSESETDSAADQPSRKDRRDQSKRSKKKAKPLATEANDSPPPRLRVVNDNSSDERERRKRSSGPQERAHSQRNDRNKNRSDEDLLQELEIGGETESDSNTRRLSKSERRKLRKQSRREHRRAA